MRHRLVVAAVVGTLSVGTDAWARGGGGRGGKAYGMSWGGNGMMGGKPGHGRHFRNKGLKASTITGMANTPTRIIKWACGNAVVAARIFAVNGRPEAEGAAGAVEAGTLA